MHDDGDILAPAIDVGERRLYRLLTHTSLGCLHPHILTHHFTLHVHFWARSMPISHLQAQYSRSLLARTLKRVFSQICRLPGGRCSRVESHGLIVNDPPLFPVYGIV